MTSLLAVLTTNKKDNQINLVDWFIDSVLMNELKRIDFKNQTLSKDIYSRPSSIYRCIESLIMDNHNKNSYYKRLIHYFLFRVRSLLNDAKEKGKISGKGSSMKFSDQVGFNKFVNSISNLVSNLLVEPITHAVISCDPKNVNLDFLEFFRGFMIHEVSKGIAVYINEATIDLILYNFAEQKNENGYLENIYTTAKGPKNVFEFEDDVVTEGGYGVMESHTLKTGGMMTVDDAEKLYKTEREKKKRRRSLSAKPLTRKCPEKPAKNYKLGTKKRGKNGKMWIVKKTRAGKRWMKA